jgi:hypothetical protein
LGETLGWIDAEKSHPLVTGIDNHSKGLIEGIADLQAMNGEIRLQPWQGSFPGGLLNQKCFERNGETVEAVSDLIAFLVRFKKTKLS